MKKFIGMVTLIILDLMSFFLVENLVENKTAKISVLVGLILVAGILIYIALNEGLGKFQKNYNNVIENILEEKNLYEKRFNELLSENKKAKEELENNQNLIKEELNRVHLKTFSSIEKLLEVSTKTNDNIVSLAGSLESNNNELKNIFENQLDDIGIFFNKSLENVKSNLIEALSKNNSDLLNNFNNNMKNLDKLIIKENDSIKNMIEIISNNNAKAVENIANINTRTLEGFNIVSKDISNLLNKEGEFISSIENSIIKMNEILDKELQKINLEIKQGNENNASILEKLKASMDESVSSMGILFDDTLRGFKEEILDQNDSNNSSLNRAIQKNIKDMKSQIALGNEELNNITQNIAENNKVSLDEAKNIINNISMLQTKLLSELDNNQKKMLELNESDIELMKKISNIDE